MRKHLLARHDSIPRGEIDVMVEEWGKGVNFSALDPRIVKIEAAWLAKQYKLSHVKHGEPHSHTTGRHIKMDVRASKQCQF